MQPGDLVQIKLPFQKSQGVLVERVRLPYEASCEMENGTCPIPGDCRWTVLYEGRMTEFHQHNLEVIG